MNQYLASGNSKDLNSFFFNLSFELLNGCPFNCKGCFVNKEGQEIINDVDANNLIKLLESVSQEPFYTPFIAFIQPTDFLAANNTADILKDPRIIKVLNYFKRLSFQSTYLNIDNAEEISKVLNAHYSNLEIEFNIIIEPQHIKNPKYLNVIERNQNTVHEILNWPTKIHKFGIMNVFDYDDTKVSSIIKDYKKLHQEVDYLFDTKVDFNFSLGRKDKKLSSEEFYKAADQIRNIYTADIEEIDKYAQSSASGRLTDSLVERQYNWSGGKFYYSPLLYERFASFITDFEIPIKDYTIQEFEQFEEQVQIEQYTNLHNKTECGDCHLLGSCVNRGILRLMDIHDVQDCLVAKDAIHVVNAMGTLPIGH